MTTEFEKRTAECFTCEGSGLIISQTPQGGTEPCPECDPEDYDELTKIRRGDLAALRRNLPEGLCVVPREMTDNQAEAVVRQAKCCGGIAESIYHDMIAAFEKEAK